VASFTGLPGAENVERGVRDLNAGRRTVEALLVAAAATRLREEPERALYALLGAEPDPYYRYNALRRELDSFLAALESRSRTR
jgi:hypothetical protein